MKPITRANFAIGAEKEKQYGYRINEKCIGCGLCTSKCPQNCIDTLSIPFRIREIIAFIVVIAWKFVLIMQWKRLKKQQNT